MKNAKQRSTPMQNIIIQKNKKSREKIRQKKNHIREQAVNQRYDSLKAKEIPDFGREINKKDLTFALLFMQNGKPTDARFFKTKSTLDKFINDKHKKHNLDILLHPQPVLVKHEFWQKYRETKNGYERLSLFKEHKILEDNNIFRIETIWIDIDSEFNQSFDTLNKFVRELQNYVKDDINIVETLTLIRTKSSRLRFAFSIIPLIPSNKNKNHKTHLENVREFIKIVNMYFKKHNLNADATFTRVNHPIWLTKKQQTIFEAEKEIDFYVLYSAVKKLQRELGLYEEKPQKKKKEKKQIKHLPSFIANKLSRANEDCVFEKAVSTLYRNSLNRGRYIYFLQTLAGWCKYLNKSYNEYYDIAYNYCEDKKKDIETAWRYARELEFKADKKESKYNFEELADKVIKYLKQHKRVKRKELLEMFFNKQEWLEQEIMLQLKLAGLVEETYEKQKGAGRPSKIYMIVEQVEEHQIEQKQEIITEQENTSIREDMSANPCKIGFTQLITNKLSLDNLQYGGGWKENNVCTIALPKEPIISEEEELEEKQIKEINISVSPKATNPELGPEKEISEELRAFEEKKRKLLEQLNRELTEEEKRQLREKAEKEKQKKLEEEIKQKIEEIRKTLEKTYEKKLQSLQPLQHRQGEEEIENLELLLADEEDELETEHVQAKQIDYVDYDPELLPSPDDYLRKPNSVAIKKIKKYRMKYKAILNYDWQRLSKDDVLYFLINTEKIIEKDGLKSVLKTLKYADMNEQIENPTGWLVARFSISLKNSRFLYLITKKSKKYE